MTEEHHGGSPLHPALSQRQAFALLSEGLSAHNLMRDSIDAIRGLREPIIHSDAVFTLGSIGVEKAMKIMLGCAKVERTGQWPTVETMSRRWGHDIEALWRKVLQAAKDGADNAVSVEHVRALLGRIESSTILPDLFATLSRYGRSGRFYNLDIVATDEPGQFEAPIAYWTTMENNITQRFPDMQVPATAVTSNEEFDAFLTRVSNKIATELDVWWFAMHRLGVQGCFGALGKQMGIEIWPMLRPEPTGL